MLQRSFVLLSVVGAYAVASSAHSCFDVADGPNTINVCSRATEDREHAAHLSSLPRNAFGGSVSADLVDYDILDCPEHVVGEDYEACSFVEPDTDSATNPESTSVIAYGAGISSYAGFAIAVGFLAPLLAILLCICRCGSCCCFCRLCGCCEYGTCGQSVPTAREDAFILCKPCCGFVPAGEEGGSSDGKQPATSEIAMAGAAEQMTQMEEQAYPCWERWAVRVWGIIFIIFVVVYVSLGQASGIGGVTDAAVSLSVVPNGPARVIQELSLPINNRMEAVAQDGVSPFLQSFRALFTGQVIDLGDLRGDVACVINGTAQMLPTDAEFDSISGLVDDVLVLIEDIRDDLAAPPNGTIPRLQALSRRMSNVSALAVGLNDTLISGLDDSTSEPAALYGAG